MTSQVWAADFVGPEHLIPGGARLNVAAFPAPDAVTVTAGTGGAAQGAGAIPVVALSGPIPNGTILAFGAGEFAKLTAAAAAGAESLTVEALVNAIEEGDTATYAGVRADRPVPSGTFVGRTLVERDAGTGFGPADANDDELYLVAFDVDAVANPDLELYRPGSAVFENLLPGWAGMAADLKVKLRAKYVCISGRA
jgi:hypothetical protein